MNDICIFCGYALNGSKYTLTLNDFKKHKVEIQGHDECTLEAMNKIKSYKNFQSMNVKEIVKRLKVEIDLIDLN